MEIQASRDTRVILILSGVERSPALVIQCTFEVEDMFAIPGDERLFVLDRSAMEVHELQLGEQRIRTAEEVDYRLSTEYGVHEVRHADLSSRRFVLEVPVEHVPRHLAAILGPAPDSRERLLLWSDRPDSLLAAVLPTASKATRGPLRLRLFLPAAMRSISSARVSLRCAPIDTGLAATILSNSNISDLAPANRASFAWAADAVGSRIIELALPSAGVSSKVIVDSAAVARTCHIDGVPRLSHLATYEPPVDLSQSVADTITYVNQKTRGGSPMTREKRTTLSNSLLARHLFLLVEQKSRAIVLMSRILDSKSGVRLDLGIMVPNLASVQGDLQIVQNAGEGLIIWSASSDAFVEIDPKFSVRALMFKRALELNRDSQKRSLSKSPDT